MRRRTRSDGVFAVSGWLFAELAVVVMVIALGSVAMAGPPPTPPPPPPCCTSPPRPPAHEEGVLLKSVDFTVFVEPDGPGTATVQDFNEKLANVVGPTRKVGLALLFGVSRDGDWRHGSAVSERLRTLVADAPGLRSAVDVRAYIGDSDDGGHGEVRVELFLLTQSG